MDGAKEIARDMLDAINFDSHGFISYTVKGFISFPVSFYYLGYDFMDANHRRENFDDKMRVAKLIKSGRINSDTLGRIISVFTNDFSSRVDIDHIAKNIAGTSIGKFIFSQVTGINLGKAIAERAVTVISSGIIAGALLSIGAETARAIYTSRYLREKNPNIHQKLREMGDLDLLYFLVEDVINPFEQACGVDERNHEEFNKICEYFFGGL